MYYIYSKRSIELKIQDILLQALGVEFFKVDCSLLKKIYNSFYRDLSTKHWFQSLRVEFLLRPL